MVQYTYKKKKKVFPKKARKIFGACIFFGGVGILIYFFFPIISYRMFLGNSGNIIEVPVPKYEVVNLLTKGISSLTTDFTDARNWYPSIHAANNTSVAEYNISIPKLKITDAKVSTMDYDLANHLVQYAGTSIPGENGTTVIFGHSTLPQLFNQKNYKTIFANLHTLKKGDVVKAKVSGKEYLYKVFSIVVTTPEDTNMFSQSYDHSYLTIVTCTPPGTVWKRLVVRAALEEDKRITLNK